LPVFSFNFAAAVVLYFVVSNLFRVGQQAIITRQFYSDEAKEKLEIKVAEARAAMPAEDDASSESKSKPKSKDRGSDSGGAHGSRRPTSRPPRRRRSNDPKNRPSSSSSGSSGDKPVKPQKKSTGRVTPKNDTDSSRRRKGK